MQNRTRSNSRGFSLIEVVIVVVIIGVIAAIAIPRMSRGAAAARDAALKQDLTLLRNAVDLYTAEHDNTVPPFTGVATHLTGYSNFDADAAQAAKDTTHYFGPYIKAIPALPVGSNKGDATFADGTGGAPQIAGGAGWWYDENTGTVKANLADTEVDDAGVQYNAY